MMASVGYNLEGTVEKSRIALNRAVTRLEKKKVMAAGQLSQDTRDKSCDAAIKCRGSPLQVALHIYPWHPRVYM